MPSPEIPNDGPNSYPTITRAQWAVLNAMTDQRCEHMMEAMDFVSDLSPEAKKFLRDADKEKIKALNANLEFFATSKAVWKFLWVGGASLAAFLLGLNELWKAVGEYISVKFK